VKISSAIDGYLLFKATWASDTTIETDRVLFRQFLAWLDADTIRRYLEYHKERGLSAHTRWQQCATPSDLYTWLSSADVALVSRNPARAVPPPKKPK
jgi:site-specific recombinase XerD